MPRSSKTVLKPGGAPGQQIKLYRLGDGRTAFVDKWGGDRKTRVFTSENVARRESEILANKLLRGEAVRHNFGPKEIAMYQAAQELIIPKGMPILSVVQEWVKASDLCGDRNLMDVVRSGMETISRPQKKFREVVQLFLASKRLEGVSEIYFAELTEDLTAFSKVHGEKPIGELGTEEVADWLSTRTYNGRMIGPRRRNNIRGTLVTLFKFAQKQQPALLPPGPTAPQLIGKAKDKRIGSVSVFTPVEMRFWLSRVRADFLPWIAIGGFSGVRTEEICPPPESEKDRLRWSDFNWKKGHINIRPDISKTGERRIVPILDNLSAWLEPWHAATGPVVPLGMRTDREAARLSRVSKRLTLAMEKDPQKFHHPCPGLVWRHNALRHSACSYRMAILKNAPQVAYEAGNSVPMIKRHYHEAQEEDVAKAYYAIMPGDASAPNVIQFNLGL